MVLHKGEALPPCLFNFALAYGTSNGITKPEKNEKGGTHQLVVCADDADIMRENICTVQKKTKVLLVASKALGLEVTAEKTKYMAMPREKKAKKSHHPES